jgi:hypothetical protein
MASAPEIVADPRLTAFSHAELFITLFKILKFMARFRSNFLRLTHALRLFCQASDFDNGEMCNLSSGPVGRNDFTKWDSATVHPIAGAHFFLI